MYKGIIKPLLFRFSPEKVHYFVFHLLQTVFMIPGLKRLFLRWYVYDDRRLRRQLFGLEFKNPVGLAAGFDKDARLYNELEGLGFGFVEIGTITPLAQDGNPKPRLFRLPEDEALLNRMGFNNGGVEAARKRLQYKDCKILVGGNIGKNKVTPNEEAISDYEKCFDALKDVVDYFVVNVSSPNTPNLRELQDKEPLKKLLNRMVEMNSDLPDPLPVLLKIAPDLTNEQLDDIIDIVDETGIDGVIATNTTISRDELVTDSSAVEALGNGGISGKPVTDRSTEVIRYLHNGSKGAFPIIGVGGIHSAEDAIEKLKAGASLVQIYTGFIYEGPGLINRINREIVKLGL